VRSPTRRTDGRSTGAFDGAASDERADAREQLGDREGLREVVVGAGVQAGHTVGDRVARGQHQDRAPPAGITQAAAHGEPVHLGQHHVEDDRVVRVLGAEPQPLAPVRGHVDRVPLLLERALEQAGHLHPVLDDEHAHGPSCAGSAQRMPGTMRAG